MKKGLFFTESFTNSGQKDKIIDLVKTASKTENRTIYIQINRNCRQSEHKWKSIILALIRPFVIESRLEIFTKRYRILSHIFQTWPDFRDSLFGQVKNISYI